MKNYTEEQIKDLNLIIKDSKLTEKVVRNRKIYKHFCRICGTGFENNRQPHKAADTCSTICDYELKRRINSIEFSKDSENIKCLECGLIIGKQLTNHLRVKHNMSTKQYMEKHQVDKYAVYSKSTLQKMSDRISGDKNPGYQHGGTLSPFSKKFVSYKDLTEEEKEKTISDFKISVVENTPLEQRSTCIEYYLSRGHSTEEAQRLLSERQTTFSYDICVQKYGQEEGERIWRERQNKWQTSLNALSDEEKQRINKEKTWNKGATSNIANELFSQLHRDGSYWGKSNQGQPGEYYLPRQDTNTGYYLDFVFKNKVIEFFGDYWHCNPIFYTEPGKFISSYGKNQTVQQIWDRDAARLDYCRQAGFEILVIWENDFRFDKSGIIKKCNEFLDS